MAEELSVAGVPSSNITSFRNSFNELVDRIFNFQRVTFYNNENYNPVSKTFLDRTDIPNFRQRYVTIKHLAVVHWQGNVNLTPKQLRDSLERPEMGFYWEKSKDTIGGFEFIAKPDDYETIIAKEQFDCGNDNRVLYVDYFPNSLVERIVLQCMVQESYSFRIRNSYFVVNYVPMSDLKISYDNTNESKDVNLYNQNGKFTDSLAMSKLLTSYQKEIEGDNLTKYLVAYDFNSLPKVGDVFTNNSNERYVMNNMSINVFQNEDDYYYVCECTLSKKYCS